MFRKYKKEQFIQQAEYKIYMMQSENIRLNLNKKKFSKSIQPAE